MTPRIKPPPQIEVRDRDDGRFEVVVDGWVRSVWMHRESAVRAADVLVPADCRAVSDHMLPRAIGYR